VVKYKKHLIKKATTTNNFYRNDKKQTNESENPQIKEYWTLKNFILVNFKK